jgi:hypothetical protein
MADGTINVEVSTQAAQAELERLRAENARLAREAHSWWAALAGATAEVENWRRRAERCVTAWTVVRGGVWDLGLKRRELYAHDNDWPKLQELAAKLQRKRERLSKQGKG